MQIYTALSLYDEKELINLLDKFNLYCIPRSFSVSKPNVSKLGYLSEKEQVIISGDFKEEVFENIKPIKNDPSKFHITPKKGNCIEWTRSVTNDDKKIHTPGRFYFKPDLNLSKKRSLYLTKVYNFIYRRIKKHSFKSTGENPIYIGQKLASLIQQDQIKLIYPNGERVAYHYQ